MLKKWLHPPIFPDDEDKTRIAGMLHLILLVLLGALIAAMLLVAVGNVAITNSSFFAFSAVTGPAAIILLLVFLHKGYVRLVAWAFVLFQLTSTVTQMIGSGGINSPAISAFIVTLLLAAFLIGERATVVFGLISVLSILGIWRLQIAGLLPAPYVFSTIPARLFFILTVIVVTTALLQLVVRSLNDALIHSRAYGKELEQVIQQKTLAEQALQHTTEQLETLHEIDRSLLSARSLREIADDALARIRRLIPCRRASITLFDLPKREAFFLAASFHRKIDFPLTPISFEGFGLSIIETLQQNQAWIVDNVLTDPRSVELDRRLAAEDGIYAWLSVPLLAKGELIGALNLGRGAGEFFVNEETEITRDIADQLAIAIQQTKLNNALQEELAERQKLIQQLEANNAELERFTYTVSHDLRNPLVTIKGFLGMLEKDLQENNRDRVSNDLQRISNAADKMQALLVDLLELSRIGRIINPPTELNLTELAIEAVETLDALIRSKNINVIVSLDLPVVHGDRVRLREVFENLIDNAAKYMGDQQHPLIEIGCKEGEEKVIFVKDNGIGIETSYSTKIFGLFEKLNPTSEGTGIGLALVKRIIEVHGGRIWVESEGRGKGSTFYFTIPDGRENKSGGD